MRTPLKPLTEAEEKYIADLIAYGKSCQDPYPELSDELNRNIAIHSLACDYMSQIAQRAIEGEEIRTLARDLGIVQLILKPVDRYLALKTEETITNLSEWCREMDAIDGFDTDELNTAMLEYGRQNAV
jgi:predicted transcriptional regulator